MRVAFVTTDNREPFKQYGNPAPWFGPAPEAVLEGMTHVPELEVHVVSCIQKPVRAPEKLADNIWFHSLHVPKLGWMRSGYSGCILAIRKRISAIKPDIVHGQGTERECALGAVFSGYPNVLTIHGHMGQLAKLQRALPLTFSWNAALLERFAVARTDGVVCLSRYSQRVFDGTAKKTWLVPNATLPDYFSVLKHRPGKRIRVLCLAHIHPWKNQVFLIQALESLVKRIDFELWFMGTRNESEYSREFLRMVKRNPWCKHIGSGDAKVVRKILSEVDVLILPSVEDNCPMAILEGMAAGLPVVASNIGGVPDLVDPGKTGLLFDPHDANSISHAVETLLKDQTLMERMGSAGRERARTEFSIQAIARRQLEVYSEVLG